MKYSLQECWEFLGVCPRTVADKILSHAQCEDQVKEAERSLEVAKKLAKKIMAKNHPDVNPNGSKKFLEVPEVLECLDHHTGLFIARLLSKQNRPKSETRVVIKGY